jgi:hypothetical protein
MRQPQPCAGRVHHHRRRRARRHGRSSAAACAREKQGRRRVKWSRVSQGSNRPPGEVLYLRISRSTVGSQSAEMDGSPRPGDNRAKSAQMGGDGGPKWRPARRLLGRRPMRVRGGRSWTVFSFGPKKGCEQCISIICSTDFKSIFV